MEDLGTLVKIQLSDLLQRGDCLLLELCTILLCFLFCDFTCVCPVSEGTSHPSHRFCHCLGALQRLPHGDPPLEDFR